MDEFIFTKGNYNINFFLIIILFKFKRKIIYKTEKKTFNKYWNAVESKYHILHKY